MRYIGGVVPMMVDGSAFICKYVKQSEPGERKYFQLHREPFRFCGEPFRFRGEPFQLSRGLFQHIQTPLLDTCFLIDA